MKSTLFTPSVYAISPTQENTKRLLQQIEAALQAGVKVVQYRDKTLAPALRLQQAQALRALCHHYKSLFLINDDVALAKACDADGVHLGQSDMPIQMARATLGEEAMIGITCHNSLELAQTAAQKGADYLSFGCFFPSSTKPLAKPADLAILTAAQARFNLPIVAIGGIDASNAHLLWHGADLLAVCAGIFDRVDIGQAVGEIMSKLNYVNNQNVIL